MPPPLVKELLRGEVAEGLMRSEGVVGVLVGTECRLQGSEAWLDIGAGVELLARCSLHPFHLGIELGRPRREHEELDALSLAVGPELGPELIAPIDLDGRDGKGKAGCHFIPDGGSPAAQRGRTLAYRECLQCQAFQAYAPEMRKGEPVTPVILWLAVTICGR